MSTNIITTDEKLNKIQDGVKKKSVKIDATDTSR